MSKILKFAVIGSTIALLSTATGVANADGHEQARQVLQRSQAKAEAKPVIGVVRVVARDGHEQARLMIEGASFVAQEGGPQYESAGLIVESDETVDAHTKARNLLARSLVTKPHATRAGRASAGVKTTSKQRAANDD